MTNLKGVFGFNEYCGPGVISIITGVSTDRAAAVISAITGKRVIKGVQTSYLLQAFDRLGYDQKRMPLYASLLGGVLMQLCKQDGFYIAVVPEHFVAIEINKGDIWFCDNHSKQPINAAASARLTQRVEQVYQIIPRADKVQPPAPLIPPVPKPNPNPVKFFIKTTVHSDRVEVNKFTEYDDTSVGREVIGLIRFKSEAEFSEIVNAIMEAFEGADK